MGLLRNKPLGLFIFLLRGFRGFVFKNNEDLYEKKILDYKACGLATFYPLFFSTFVIPDKACYAG